MKNGLRQSMAWLHTWSGLLVGWVLFAVFLTGTASYLRPEITRWMRPGVAASTVDPARSALAAVAELRQRALGSPSWFITLPGERDPVTVAFWREPGLAGRGIRQEALDPVSGAVLTDGATRGGEFFYRFHFQLHHMPVLWGRWIVSICAMFMLVAIISGIITHKRIFADFFTFRPRKGQRSWLDGHAAAAVLALPYHLMITYTGLVTLMAMVLPWGIGAAYGPAGPAAFFADGNGFTPPRAAGRPGTLGDVTPMLQEAARVWGAPPFRINVLNPADANSTVVVYREADDSITATAAGMAFAGTTGQKLKEWDDASAVQRTRGVLVGLHTGHFAGPLLRVLFLLAGLAGTAMVGTGCVLWSAKRRKPGAVPHAGQRLVDVLNVATIGGLPMAMVAFLWGNRLLPPQLEGRADWEIQVFFAAWALCLLHAVARPHRSAWVEQFSGAAALCLLLPVVNALTTQRHLGRSLLAGDWGMAGFDLGVLAIGCTLALMARLCSAPQGAPNRAQPLPSAAE